MAIAIHLANQHPALVEHKVHALGAARGIGRQDPVVIGLGLRLVCSLLRRLRLLLQCSGLRIECIGLLLQWRGLRDELRCLRVVGLRLRSERSGFLLQCSGGHVILRRLRLIELFATLETMDPEVATRILDMLGERLNAAQWIVRPVPGLGGMTPVQALAEGRRQDLLDLLFRVEHGLFS